MSTNIMAKKRIRIIFSIIVLTFIFVFGAGSTEEIQEKETESFKNLPTLIEYVLDMLERRPEILETDDVNVFKRSVDDDDNYKEGAHKSDENSPCKNINEYTIIKNAGQVEDRNDMYIKSPNDNNDDFDVTNIESVTGEGNIKTNAKEEQESDGVSDYDVYEAVRKTKLSLLSPEEVEEQILKVDQMIEDYYSKESNG